MNVIGISGLHHSVAFKRKHFPYLDRNRQRLAQGVDSAAALVSDRGVEAAAAQERFCDDKGTGRFPLNAIEYCLSRSALTLDQVDYVAHGFAYETSPVHEIDDFTRERYRRVYSPAAQLAVLREHYPAVDWQAKYVPVGHHLAHAASSYYLSGMRRAVVVVVDGMGEWESLTVAVARDDDVRVVRQVPAMHSLGILYSVFTLYLGFMAGMDEYKVMGLASCGDSGRYLGRLMDWVHLGPEGRFSLPLLAEDRSTLERETHSGVLATLMELFGPPRQPDDEICQRHMDIAAALQVALQTCLIHVLAWARAETQETQLCMAGGVALNCSANGAIYRSGLFRKIHIQPAAGDDGSALGAALLVHRRHRPSERRWHMSAPTWGPEFSAGEIAACLEGADCEAIHYERVSDLVAETAELIAAGNVVAWFQGRMEFGPRALGNRSILADPRDARMRGHLNSIVKQREEFRPFAPAVTREDACRFFEIQPGDEEMFANMLIVAPTRPTYRSLLPAVTHVDGTARVQVVSRGSNPRFWRLLRAFEELTEVPVVVNTSFNLRGQPIVCTPGEALATFLRSKIDRLVMGNWIVTRRRSSE
jgi:carbamoyltransferase